VPDTAKTVKKKRKFRIDVSEPTAKKDKINEWHRANKKQKIKEKLAKIEQNEQLKLEWFKRRIDEKLKMSQR